MLPRPAHANSRIEMNTGTRRWQLGFTMSLTTAVLWGLLPIALKVALTGMDAYTITWWRFAVSMLGLGVFLAWRGQLPRMRGAGSRAWTLLGIALVTLLGNYVLYLVALDHTTPSVAAGRHPARAAVAAAGQAYSYSASASRRASGSDSSC